MLAVETLAYPNYKDPAMYTLFDNFQPVVHDVHKRLRDMGEELAK
jgi:hypothetical protein